MADFSEIINRLKHLKNYVENDMHEIIGTEAVNHFTESFDNQGFTDSSLKKWDDVKRKDTTSSWYGFKYGSRAKKPANHPSRKGVKSAYKARKDNPITNYSNAATKRPILSGDSKKLGRSLKWKKQGNSIVVYSDLIYAKIQNEGGTIKVFGKRTAKVKARPFIGESKILNEKIKREIEAEINKILS